MLEIGAGLGSLTLALAETGATGGGGGDGPPPGPRPALGRRAGRRRGGRGGRPDARPGGAAGRAGAGPVEPGGQPALQRGHPARAADPGRGAGGDPPAGHGAAGGGRAHGRRGRASDAYGAVSVRIAYFARAEVVGPGARLGVRPAAAGRVGPGAPRAAARARRSIRRWSPTSGWTRSCGPASPSGARCSGAPWPAWSSPTPSRGPGCGPTPGPRSSSVAEWGRLAAPREPTVRVAPAKLTVSLRVTGVRADGYHELDAEMVTLEPGRRARARRGRRRVWSWRPSPGTRAADLPAPGGQPGHPGAGAPAGGRPAVRLTKRIPARRRAGRRLGRRGGRAALGGLRRPGGGGAPRCRRALLPGGRPGPGRGRGRAGHARCPSRPATTCCCCRPSAWTPPGSTGPGTSDPGRRGAQRADGGRAGRRAPAGRAGATPWGSWRAASRTLAGQRVDLVRRGRPGGGGHGGRPAAAGGVRDGPAGAGPHGAGGLGGRLRGREGGERARRGATCRPGAASGWPSASSCASSCASACGAS